MALHEHPMACKKTNNSAHNTFTVNVKNTRLKHACRVKEKKNPLDKFWIILQGNPILEIKKKKLIKSDMAASAVCFSPQNIRGCRH